MSLANTSLHPSSSCLVLVSSDDQGFFSAQLVGLPEIRASAKSRETAVEQLRTMVQEWIDSGQLQPVEMPTEPSLMKWFGHAKQDPDFADYLGELRRFRAEEDPREGDFSDESGCSDSSSIPIT